MNPNSLVNSQGHILEELSEDLFNILMANPGHPEIESIQRSRENLWEVFERIKRGEEHTIVALPSLTFTAELLENIPGISTYEQRNIWEALSAMNPQTSVILVTCEPIPRSGLEHLIEAAGLDKSVMERIKLFPLPNPIPNVPLTRQILGDPNLLNELKSHIKTDCAYLAPFHTTNEECLLAQSLEIPVFGIHPHLEYFHGKSGNKKIFNEANIPTVDGLGDIRELKQLKMGIRHIWSRHPELEKIMLKLNQGVSGDGNACLRLPFSFSQFLKLNPESQEQCLTKLIEEIKFCSEKMTSAKYIESLKNGAVVEEFIAGEIKDSPSCQGMIAPNGEVKIFSTHEQILDESGQRYLGCHFPCKSSYREKIMYYTRRVGQVLAKKGVLGFFGVDYVVSEEKIYAIEINIRQGGTTHPFQMTSKITNSHLCPETHVLRDVNQQPYCYRSFDNYTHPGLSEVTADILLTYMRAENLLFSQEKKSGVVFYLLNALDEYNKLGFVCIGHNQAEINELYEATIKALEGMIREFAPSNADTTQLA